MADKRIASYPLFYKYRMGVSDKAEIFRLLRLIPKSRHKEVSRQYEALYLADPYGKGSNDANDYLNDIAKEYRSEN